MINIYNFLVQKLTKIMQIAILLFLCCKLTKSLNLLPSQIYYIFNIFASIIENVMKLVISNKINIYTIGFH